MSSGRFVRAHQRTSRIPKRRLVQAEARARRSIKCIFIKGSVDECGVSMGFPKSTELIRRKMEEYDFRGGYCLNLYFSRTGYLALSLSQER